MSSFILGLLRFVIGGVCYYGIELVWRGYSHYAMFIVGGLCFAICGLIDDIFPKWNKWLQIIVSASIITLLEFISGCILNLGMGLDIWDYSHLPMNILGQVCIPFTLAWAILSVVIFWLDKWVRKNYKEIINKVKSLIKK